MATVLFHGKQGKAVFNSEVIIAIISWTATATCETVDSTAMASTADGPTIHWKTYLKGFKDWTATIECHMDDTGFDAANVDLDTDFAQDTDGLALVLYEGMVAADQVEDVQVHKWSGNAMITGITVGTDKDGLATCTYALQGSGALTEAASDAT